MYTGLKGVQGGDKVGKTLTQARIQTGKDETWGRGKQTNKKKPQHQGIRGKDKSIHRRKARQNNHQNRPEVE